MTEIKKVGKLPPEWEKAKRIWDDTPEEDKKAFYERNAAMLDRWQAETDAMCQDDDDEEE